MARVIRSARRKVAWFGSNDGTGSGIISIATGNTLGDNGFHATGAAGVPDAETTLVRTRGELFWHVAADLASSSRFAIGLIRVNDVAAAAGSAALPSPLENPNDDWIWWYSSTAVDLAGAAALSSGFMGGRRVDIDSKSMRIIKDSQTVVWVAEATVAGISYAVNCRYLVKLT